MSVRNMLGEVRDPVQFARFLWPNVTFYRKQREILYSVHHNDETIVPAGNMLGKDFVSGYITLWFFLTRTPCRVLTTSVDHEQLESVLWGEIRRFIQSAKYPLESTRGGPLVVNHLHLRKNLWDSNGKLVGMCPLSYVIARVAARGEGMLGHHVAETGDSIPKTMMIADEASGIDDITYERGTTWARRILAIGNPFPCSNFFYRAVKGDGDQDKGGDIPRKKFGQISRVNDTNGGQWNTNESTNSSTHSQNPNLQNTSVGSVENSHESNGSHTSRNVSAGQPNTNLSGYYRKVIKIRAEDSPNVRLGLAQIKQGKEPTGEVLIPGVLPYNDYAKRRALWDKIRQCVSLDAEFWEGAETLLFPPDWLNRAERAWLTLRGRKRKAKSIGIDTAEGGDNTSMYAIDELGVVDRQSKKTPDTECVARDAIAFWQRLGVDPSMVFFDRGGGGKWVADRLRAKGHNVQTIGFGSPPTQLPKTGKLNLSESEDERESRYTFSSKRVEMYYDLSELLDPSRQYGLGPYKSVGTGGNAKYSSGSSEQYYGFALPPDPELRRQLAPIPRLYDEEGRVWLPPKRRKTGDRGKAAKAGSVYQKSLEEIIGRSPDDADALVLAIHGLVGKHQPSFIGGELV